MADSAAADQQTLDSSELRARRRALGLSQENLARELGVSGNTLARWERGQQRLSNPRMVRLALERLELPTTAAQIAGPAAARRNLPPMLTSFIGRRRELRALRQLVSTGRLVTVSGAAGIGKTRLAIEAARGLSGHYPDGVWLVELATVDDPNLVPHALLAALRVPEEPTRPRLETIIARLTARRLLLVLDNCEHLVPICTDMVAELLRGCPMLHILATSREPLGAADEVVWRVPPLSLPAPDEEPLPERVLRSEAAALLVARACAAEPSFALGPTNAAAVAEICRRLDGLPLALELAAARLRALGPNQLAVRLSDRFHLLVDGPSGRPAHHETLQATIAWSYGMLSAVERRLFERLSVFAGGWTLEAAGAVCSAGDVTEEDVPRLQGRLIDRSLVMTDVSERYRLLDTLRAYAALALDPDDRVATGHRHAAFYLALTEAAEPRLVQADQVEWAACLDQDLPNIRVALAWFLAPPGEDVAMGLRLASALTHYWQLGPHLQEGRDWLQRLLKAAPENLPERAGAWWADGFLAWQVGDLGGAAAAYQAGLECALRTRTSPYLARLQVGLGAILCLVGGDVSSGKALVDEGLAAARERGELWTVGHALFWLGNLAHLHGDYAQAWTFLEASEVPAREVGDRRDLAYVLMIKGYLAITTGNHTAGLRAFREALPMTHAVGDPLGTIWALEGIITTLLAGGQTRLAARLTGAVDAQRSALRVGQDPVPGWQEVRERTRAGLTRSLGEQVFATAAAEGRRLALERALAEALGEIGQPGRPAMRRPSEGGLSRREWQVARLVARGLSNRQIAQELVIAEGTAQRHVANILGELGLASRAELTAWVASEDRRALTS